MGAGPVGGGDARDPLMTAVVEVAGLRKEYAMGDDACTPCAAST